MANQSEDNPFSSPTSTSDVVLVVEGQKLHVNKGVLAVMSPVFERMFHGEYKESCSSEVPLPGKNYDEMVEFLLCLYPTTSKKITRETVEVVMMLADEYQVQRIFDRCVKFLTAKSRGFVISEMVHFLRVSEDKDHLKKVYDHFILELSRNYSFRNKKEEDEFDELSLETRYKVLLKRVCYLEYLE